MQIGLLRVQDLTSEVSEFTEANIQLKQEASQAAQAALVGRSGASPHLSPDVAVLRSELESERKLKLVNGAHHYEQTSEWLSELNEKDELIKLRGAELLDKDQILKTNKTN